MHNQAYFNSRSVDFHEKYWASVKTKWKLGLLKKTDKRSSADSSNTCSMSLVTVQTSVEQFLRSQLCEDCDENQHFIQFSTIFLFFILFRHKPLFSAVTFSNFYGKDCRYYFSENIFKIKSNKSWDFYLKSEKVLPPPAHLNKMHILSPVPSLIERT